MKNTLLFTLVLILSPLAARAESWAGSWETTFGIMSLNQSGAKVSGEYVMAGFPCKIEGTVSGMKLRFTYIEPKAAGEGWFELNGDEFRGQWKENGSPNWSSWVGKRIEKSLSFAGVWNTSFGPMRLLENGKGEVRGIYAQGDGARIWGKRKGVRFEFEYKESGSGGKGWFELSADGRSFAGKWLQNGKSDWLEWRGNRLNPIPGRVWLVVLEAAWQTSYDPREYAFGDMLKAFFDQTPNVEVRRRPLTDEKGAKRWLDELAYLPEPIVLTIAAHGESDGPKGNNGTISAKALADSLQYAGSLKAVHFSSCLVMKGGYGKSLHKMLLDQGLRVSVSGYKNSVDWAVSALFEMNYFDLILARGVDPKEAPKAALAMFPAAGTQKFKEIAIAPGGFDWVY